VAPHVGGRPLLACWASAKKASCQWGLVGLGHISWGSVSLDCIKRGGGGHLLGYPTNSEFATYNLFASSVAQECADNTPVVCAVACVVVVAQELTGHVRGPLPGSYILPDSSKLAVHGHGQWLIPTIQDVPSSVSDILKRAAAQINGWVAWVGSRTWGGVAGGWA
jgi:hypothetical protein